MKYLMFTLIIAISACSPSEEDIQFAIFQTEAAKPTETGLPLTATPIAVTVVSPENFNLPKLLDAAGRVPAGLDKDALLNIPPESFPLVIPIPLNMINQQLNRGRDGAEFIMILVFSDEDSASLAHGMILLGWHLFDEGEDYFGGDTKRVDARIEAPSIGYIPIAHQSDFLLWDLGDLLINRRVSFLTQVCNALIIIEMSRPTITPDDVFQYAAALYGVVSETVCT